MHAYAFNKCIQHRIFEIACKITRIAHKIEKSCITKNAVRNLPRLLLSSPPLNSFPDMYNSSANISFNFCKLFFLQNFVKIIYQLITKNEKFCQSIVAGKNCEFCQMATGKTCEAQLSTTLFQSFTKFVDFFYPLG